MRDSDLDLISRFSPWRGFRATICAVFEIYRETGPKRGPKYRLNLRVPFFTILEPEIVLGGDSSSQVKFTLSTSDRRL